MFRNIKSSRPDLNSETYRAIIIGTDSRFSQLWQLLGAGVGEGGWQNWPIFICVTCPQSGPT